MDASIFFRGFVVSICFSLCFINSVSVKFESAEHRQICMEAVKEMGAAKDFEDLSNYGIKTLYTPQERGITLTFDKFSCQKQNDIFGSDHVVLYAFKDNNEMVEVFKTKIRAGNTVNSDRFGTTKIEAKNSIMLVLYELDTGSFHDFLGDGYIYDITAEPKNSLIFDNGKGKYTLEYTVSYSNPKYTADDGRLFDIKSDIGSVPIYFHDFCWMQGDFFAGDNPEKDVIGWDRKNNKLNSESDRKKKFMKVFQDMHKKMKSRKKRNKEMFVRLVALIDKEKAAIDRAKKANKPAGDAYHEKGKRFAMHLVTNAHSTNMALVMKGEPPSVDYHYSSATMAVASMENGDSKFFENAKFNFDHFKEGFAVDVYEAGHILAMEKAKEAHENMNDAIKANNLLKEALAIEGGSLHYASDMFATGHLRNERVSLFINQDTAGGGCGSDGERMGVVAKMAHDEENAVGLKVKNAHAEWQGYGDTYLNLFDQEQSTTFKQAVELVKASIREVIHAFKTGSVTPRPQEINGESKSPFSYVPEVIPESNKNYEPLFKKIGDVWKYRTSDPKTSPAVYTDDWDCDAVFDAFQSSSMNSRNKDKGEVVDKMRRKIMLLNSLYFEEMDLDRNRIVELAEFANWVQNNPKIGAEMEKHSIEVDIVVQRFFTKFLKTNMKVLLVEDLDVLVSSHNNKLLFPIKPFLENKFIEIIHEFQQRTTSYRFRSKSRSKGINYVKSGMNDDSDVSLKEKEKLFSLSQVTKGINWDFIKAVEKQFDLSKVSEQDTNNLQINGLTQEDEIMKYLDNEYKETFKKLKITVKNSQKVYEKIVSKKKYSGKWFGVSLVSATDVEVYGNRLSTNWLYLETLLGESTALALVNEFFVNAKSEDVLDENTVAKLGVDSYECMNKMECRSKVVVNFAKIRITDERQNVDLKNSIKNSPRKLDGDLKPDGTPI